MHKNLASLRQTPLTDSTDPQRVAWTFRLALPCALAAALLLTTGCGTRSLGNAPVEDRGTGTTQPGAEVKPPLPGAENIGKPGYYMVKPGDTMIRIGLENGQNWRDVARWNGIENPNLIEVGQVLRVVPANGDGAQVVTRPVTPGGVAVAPVPSVGASHPGATRSYNGVLPKAPPASNTNGAWIWPAQGPLVAGFNPAKNKGLDISGKAGAPVLASAGGRVVYAGDRLRGYGNLVIIKHNNIFMSSYAHNRTLLVKEDQMVRRGQKIAEMGNTDSRKVKLHFEIRRHGKPVDPAKYLPAR